MTAPRLGRRHAAVPGVATSLAHVPARVSGWPLACLSEWATETRGPPCFLPHLPTGHREPVPPASGPRHAITFPGARQRPTLTVTPPTPWPLIPSRAGACCAMGSSSSTTPASCCPEAARFLRGWRATARYSSSGVRRRTSTAATMTPYLAPFPDGGRERGAG